MGATALSAGALVAESWVTNDVLKFALDHRDLRVDSVASVRAIVLDAVPDAAIAFRATAFESDEPRLVMQVRVPDGISADDVEEQVFAALEQRSELRNAFRFLILSLE
jgi:hypothetical protein